MTRLVLSRKPGARLPAGAVSVARPSRFGNPWKWHDAAREDGVQPELARREAVESLAENFVMHDVAYPSVDEIRAALHGRDVACWCPLPREGEPDWCHAAVLAWVAAGGEPGVTAGWLADAVGGTVRPVVGVAP